MKRFELNNPFSNIRCKKIGAGAVGAVLFVESLAGCSSTNEAEHFEADLIKDPASITVCDGANVRDNPTVKDDATSGETNLITTVDYGDAPEGSCLDFSLPKDATVYRTKDPTGSDGYFIGVPESTLAEVMPNMDLNDKDGQNLVWISEQRADITDTQLDDNQSTTR